MALKKVFKVYLGNKIYINLEPDTKAMFNMSKKSQRKNIKFCLGGETDPH